MKVWAALEGIGATRFGKAISRNCALAALMAEEVAGTDHMAPAAPVTSNLCVFTADSRLSAAEQSELNKRIAVALQNSGDAVFSTTDVDGVTCLRAAITNHRTTEADVRAAIAAVGQARDTGA